MALKGKTLFITYGQSMNNGSYLIWPTNKIFKFDGDIYTHEGLEEIKAKIAKERGWPVDQVVITFFSIKS